MEIGYQVRLNIFQPEDHFDLKKMKQHSDKIFLFLIINNPVILPDYHYFLFPLQKMKCLSYYAQNNHQHFHHGNDNFSLFYSNRKISEKTLEWWLGYIFIIIFFSIIIANTDHDCHHHHHSKTRAWCLNKSFLTLFRSSTVRARNF